MEAPVPHKRQELTVEDIFEDTIKQNNNYITPEPISRQLEMVVEPPRPQEIFVLGSNI